MNAFNRNGLAALSDLENPEWKDLILFLENEQNSFLSKESLFRSPEYKWPRDPLHTWSRIWEYPYVFYHLKQRREHFSQRELPKVMDFGSGVTFFPFSVAKLGFDVMCVDIDPICKKDLNRAIGSISHHPGKVEAKLVDGEGVPFTREEFDIIYSVSVLEHTPKPHETIREIALTLKSGGYLIFTIDLDLKGNAEIGLSNYYKLIEEINNYFDYVYSNITIHPADILLSNTGPYPMKNTILIWHLIKQWMIKPLLLRKPSPIPVQYHLAIQGFVLSKKAL